MLQETKEPVVSYKKVAGQMRELLDVKEGLRTILNIRLPENRGPKTVISKHSVRNAYHKEEKENKDISITNVINEFIIVKQILLNNSIDVKVTTIFPD